MPQIILCRPVRHPVSGCCSIAAITRYPLQHQCCRCPYALFITGGGDNGAVHLFGICKPGLCGIAQRITIQLDNALIASIFGALIHSKGGITTTQQGWHIGGHAASHIICHRNDCIRIKRRIATHRPVRCHIGEQGFDMAVSLCLQGKNTVKFHKGRQAGGNRQRFGLKAGNGKGIVMPVQNGCRGTPY